MKNLSSRLYRLCNYLKYGPLSNIHNNNNNVRTIIIILLV